MCTGAGGAPGSGSLDRRCPEAVGVGREGVAVADAERLIAGRDEDHIMVPHDIPDLVVLLIVGQFSPAGEPVGVLGHIGVVPALLRAAVLERRIDHHLLSRNEALPHFPQ